SANYTDCSADDGDCGRFNQELAEDVRATRAKRFAHSDFPGSLRDADQHDVHDDDAADNKRNGSDANHDHEKAGADVLPQREKRVASLDCKIILRAVGNMMAAAHNLADFVHALLNFRSGAGPGSDAQRIALRTEFLAVSRERKN